MSVRNIEESPLYYNLRMRKSEKAIKMTFAAIKITLSAGALFNSISQRHLKQLATPPRDVTPRFSPI